MQKPTMQKPTSFCAPSASEYARTQARLARQDAEAAAERALRIALAVDQAETTLDR